jgi:hypothetical protein
MNVISYSLFKGHESDIFRFYLMGVNYNIRMSKLIYPDWRLIIHVSPDVMDKHSSFCDMYEEYIQPMDYNPQRCEGMLWRLKPIYNDGVDRVICRDLDSLVTYRESMSVGRWISSGKVAHGMNDNPAHGGMPLMGGMCGFKANEFRRLYPRWDDLVTGDLTAHGSDQSLLMRAVYPKVSDSIYFDREPAHYNYTGLAESDLCVRHIGSAGFNEMEVVRFLNKYEK